LPHPKGIGDRLVFAITAIAAFALYAFSLAPTVTLEDSGELIVAASYLGVPHPPGYPVWTMLAWLFQRVFGFATFRGYPNPALGVNLLSAVAGALACGGLALLLNRSGAVLLRDPHETDTEPLVQRDRLVLAVSAIAAGLILALAPTLWSQSVIAEVYSLNALFLVAILLLAHAWLMRKPRKTVLYLTAFLLGLGLTNNQPLVLILPALGLLLLFHAWPLGRDLAITGAVLLALLGLARLHGLEQPPARWVKLCTGAALLILLLALARHRPARPFAAVFLPVLFVMGSLALANAIPPVQHPRSWLFAAQMALCTLVLCAAWRWLPEGRTASALILCVCAGLAFYLYLPIASARNPPMNWACTKTWAGFKHAISRGQYSGLEPVPVLSRVFLLRLLSYARDLRTQFTTPLAALALVPFAAWHARFRRRRFDAAAVALLCVLATWACHAVAYRLESTGTDAVRTAIARLRTLPVLLLAAWAMLGFGLMCWGRRPPFRSVRHAFEGRARAWLLATVLAFAAFSVGLVVILNPKPDLQSQFINRVFFISSHVLFALLVGYGLVTMLRFLTARVRPQPVFVAVLATALLLPAGPLVRRFDDEAFLRNTGAPGQRGHDFGWQFGHYALCGAPAIGEELAPNEPPPPDPDYPPPMGQRAIFFGGTDPGRFVPTYQIFCPQDRPDVYLITQNALADATYTNVMRDLYGAEIWMPTPRDTQHAFQNYVRGVQLGRFPATGNISVVNGRVSVQGSQEVMHINGLIARMIFERNRHKHAFYLEESYPIPWMYPFLAPHGLIMKINPEPLAGLDNERVKKDHRFWDWYTRRLLANPRFRRDAVARKSFSKLRAAIAGLYKFRKRYGDAEHAFRQAIQLCPSSPEACLRLAELFAATGRIPDARRTLTEFLELDPENQAARRFLQRLDIAQQRAARRHGLERRIAVNGTIKIDDAVALAEIYATTRARPEFAAGLARELLRRPHAPAPLLRRLARACAPQHAQLTAALYERYLRRKPHDVDTWLELAAVRLALKQHAPARAALRRALAIGGPPVYERTRRNPRFARLWQMRAPATARARG